MHGRIGLSSCGWFAIALLLAGVGCASSPEPAAAVSGDLRWVGTWAAAPLQMGDRDLPPVPGLADNTLRQIVHVSIGGTRVRVRLSNQFGQTPMQIDSAHVAVSAGKGSVQISTDCALTFGGRSQITIPAGAVALSDPAKIRVEPLGDLAITMRFGEVPAEITGHSVSRATSYLVAGDATAAPDMPDPVAVQHWYVLDGVDVASADADVLVAFGDSITDGDKSTPDANARWPDALARRLTAAGMSNIAVLNEGIAGNRLLDNSWGRGALARLGDDALATANVRWIVLLEGVNDIGHDANPQSGQLVDQLIFAYQQIVARAHARGIRVLGGTILPCDDNSYYKPDPGRDMERQRLNQWIRTSGCFDAVIDFDATMRDPQKPTSLMHAYDSGDHLHPGDAGYRHMADSLDLSLLKH